MPVGEQTISEAMRSFNGRTARIKTARHYPKGGVNTYTLEHCHSKYGIDYEFIEDWLVPMDVIAESEEVV